MNPNQGREAAYVTSRVRDLSLITNTPDYVGLFACITPKAHPSLEEAENVVYLDKNGNPTSEHGDNDSNKVYLPQLVRDVDTLTELFGDPRVDPKTYRDLYAIRNIVQSGFACYIAKVRSGNPYSAEINTKSLFSTIDGDYLYNDQLNLSTLIQLKGDLDNALLSIANSSVVGENTLTLRLIPIKPYSLNQVVLEIVFKSRATTESEEVELCSVRVSLTPDTKNADLIKTINAYLGGDLVLQLPDVLNDKEFPSVGEAYELIEEDSSGNSYLCIANALLYICGMYDLIPDEDTVDQFSNTDLVMDNMTLTQKTIVEDGVSVTYYGLSALKTWTNKYEQTKETFSIEGNKISDAKLDFSSADYSRSFNSYKDPKYAGCFISELSGVVTKNESRSNDIYVPHGYTEVPNNSYEENKRYYVKTQEWLDPVTDYSFNESNNALIPNNTENDWRDPNHKNMEVCANPSSPTPKNKATFNQTVDSSVEPTKYIYTYDTDGLGDYVRKGNNSEIYSPINPETIDGSFEENVEAGTESSNFEAISDSNNTYIPKIYVIATYKRILKGRDIDDITNSVAQDQITAIKNLESGDSDPRFYIMFNGNYVEVIFTPVDNVKANDKVDTNAIVEMASENRRGLHYVIKEVASLRKDLTCVFTTPYHPTELKDEEVFDLNKACNWVASRGDYTNLFEYGNSQALDYSEQAFYCEMYWSWVKWRVAKLVNGLATGNSVVEMPATPFVIQNALSSYRTKGSFYPVAGDQGGILPDSCTILQNPSTKTQRDKLISYRINPIFDTGLRGIQIYGNESLNPQYTDLSAAHIARTLVQIRSRVDRYTETIKFKLNDKFTWGSWINYVNTRILEPIKAAGGLQWYKASMGFETTTREEIAQRKVRGQVSLQFTQSLEIIDLEFNVYSSALDMETET